MKRFLILTLLLTLTCGNAADTLAYYNESGLVERLMVYTGNVAGFGVRFEAEPEWNSVSALSIEMLFSSRLHSTFGGPLPITIPFIVHEAASDSAPGPRVL